jgi:hypothetical protein
MQPPNDKALYVVGGLTAWLALFWFARARHTFAGPPQAVIGMRHHGQVEPALGTFDNSFLSTDGADERR